MTDQQTDRSDRTDRPQQTERLRRDEAPPRRLDAQSAARHALEAVQSLTNRPAEGVIGVERLEDGGWIVVIELLEAARIPNTSDVIGEYEVEVDPRGRLRSYGRRSRYTRGSSSRPAD
jgi:hypothetical protein